jgi:hypothetical protein
MSVTDFGTFSNTGINAGNDARKLLLTSLSQAWARSTGHPAKYNSLEGHHNTVHSKYTPQRSCSHLTDDLDFTGRNQSNDAYPSGNMTDLWGSSFDPIFWLVETTIASLFLFLTC